jgi:hypothetical protein
MRTGERVDGDMAGIRIDQMFRAFSIGVGFFLIGFVVCCSRCRSRPKLCVMRSIVRRFNTFRSRCSFVHSPIGRFLAIELAGSFVVLCCFRIFTFSVAAAGHVDVVRWLATHGTTSLIVY